MKTFLLVFTCEVALLATPGLLLSRVLGLSWKRAATQVPIMSMAIYCLLAPLYNALSIPANPVSMALVPSLVLCVACLLTRRQHAGLSDNLSWLTLLLYLCLSLAVGAIVFLHWLPSIDAVMGEWDANFHFNRIRSFAQIQHFKLFSNSYYATADDIAIAPIIDAAPYPSAWHMFCALALQLTGTKITTVVNTANYLFAFFAFPLSFYRFMEKVFDDRAVRRFGAIACCSFAAYPWGLLLSGGVFPNLAAFSTMLAVASLFIELFDVSSYGVRLTPGIAMFLLGSVALASLHPNAIFSLVVILLPFLPASNLSTGQVPRSPKTQVRRIGNWLCATRRPRMEACSRPACL